MAKFDYKQFFGTPLVDTISERSSGVGITIDGVLLKDGGIGDGTVNIRVGDPTETADELLHVVKTVDDGDVALLIENAEPNVSFNLETVTLKFGFGGVNDAFQLRVGKNGPFNITANEQAFVAFSVKSGTEGLQEVFRLNETDSANIPFDCSNRASSGGVIARFRSTSNTPQAVLFDLHGLRPTAGAVQFDLLNNGSVNWELSVTQMFHQDNTGRTVTLDSNDGIGFNDPQGRQTIPNGRNRITTSSSLASGTYPFDGDTHLLIMGEAQGSFRTEWGDIVFRVSAIPTGTILQWPTFIMAKKGQVGINTPTSTATLDMLHVIGSSRFAGGAFTQLFGTVPTITAVVNLGVSGATSYTYKVTALMRTGETLGSTGVTTATGNAVLDGSNNNRVEWQRIPGVISYNIYRTASGGTPSSTGLIGNVVESNTGRSKTFIDSGLAATGAEPAFDSTDSFGVGIIAARELLHVSRAVDDGDVAFLLENSQANADTNETVSLKFGFGGVDTAARIQIGKADIFTASASEEAFMKFEVSAGAGGLTEVIRIEGTESGVGKLAFFAGTPSALQTGYTTFANLTTVRTLDADATSDGEIADVLGTLIEDLKSKNLISA